MGTLLFHCPRMILPAGRLAAAFLMILAALGQVGTANARMLVIGSISLDPVGEARVFQPFADFVAGQLRSQGFDGGKVVIAGSIDQMASMIRDRHVDLLIDSSVTALMINELTGSKFLLRRWRKGREAYRSVVIVRAESRFAFLSELSEETVAFEEPFSTTGYMLPALAIASVGLRLVPLEGTAQSPPGGSVGYVMGYDSETQMTWVERHQVAAAAMAEDDYKKLSQTALSPLRILYTSPVVPDHVVVYGPHLADGLVAKIRSILLSAHDSRQGADMLDGFERTTMFDDIPPDLLKNVETLAPDLRRLMEAGN